VRVPISAIDAISPAFQHTRQQLFQPLRIAQWARIALVGLLAGELTSGGCNGIQLPANTSGGHRFAGPMLPNIDPATMAGLIAFLIVFGILFWFLWIYLNSVMRFILFDTVIAKNCQIRRGWNLRQRPGQRYFLWQLLFYFAFPLGLILLFGIPAAFAFALGWFKEPKQHLVGLILAGMVLFFLFFATLVAWLVVHVLTKDFVVPQMAIEDVSAFEGWRRLFPQLKAEKGSYAGYLAMKIVMALGVAVVVGIITVIAILLVLIPVGGFGAIAVLGGKAAGLQWNLYTISAAVVIGCIVLAFVFYVISLISVPAMVFFPAYSIYFFASRYPALDALMHPAPPPPHTLPPPEAPPLPPEPQVIG
jgi:MFS family permease